MVNENGQNDDWSFDKWAETYDASIASDPGLFGRYEEVLDAVVKAARLGPGTKVLDIGVGTGNLALRCVALGARVVGLDPSQGMLAKAREKVEPTMSLQLIRADQPFLSIPFPDETFDAVVSSYAFHHVSRDKKEAGLCEMVRVLKPGGVVAIGDLIFENEEAERSAVEKYEWLDDEPFSRLDELSGWFERLGVSMECRQYTPVTWVVHAARPHRVETEQPADTGEV